MPAESVGACPTPPWPTSRAELAGYALWLRSQWLPSIVNAIAEGQAESYRPALKLVELANGPASDDLPPDRQPSAKLGLIERGDDDGR